MVDGRVRLVRHRLEVPGHRRGSIGSKESGELLRQVRSVFAAGGEIQRRRTSRRCAQPVSGTLHQSAIVPPETRIEGDVGVEEVALEEEGLDDEEAGERLADDRGLGASSGIAP